MILLCGLSFRGIAQEKGDWELGLGAGVLTTNDVFEFLDEWYQDNENPDTMDIRLTQYIPAFTATYRYLASPRLSLGFDLSYQYFREEVSHAGQGYGDIHFSFVTLATGFDYHYVARPWFRMYSGLTAAVTFNENYYRGKDPQREEHYTTRFNWQLTLAGFRVGRHFAAFGELGVGYRGVACLGVNYRF